jgi:RNA polymerase sigma-70 factor (ECF subfamily)
MSGGPLFSSHGRDPATESTSSSLVERVRANEPDAWRTLVAIYGPLIYRWCRQLGVARSDAADVAQEVFRSVASQLGGFRRSQPGDSFRGWLYTITRNKARDHFRRHQNRADATGGTDGQILLNEAVQPATDSSVEGVPTDERRLLAAQILEQLRSEFGPATMTAFWRMVVDGQAASDIAPELGMTEKAVRQAKYRVLRRLREEMKELE